MEKIEQKIIECNKCGTLQKLCHDTVKFGTSKILILGESPAKGGWIESGRAFYNKKGYLHATGKILERLLNLCDLSLEEINFTECCKCVMADRKSLRSCMQNCKPILFEQIAKIDCDIVMPMGLYPTELVLGDKIKKLSDFVGKEYEVSFNGKIKKVIPIYHTSPANPLCYSGNEEIFKRLKQEMKEEVKVGRIYRHFKGDYYIVENLATDVENGESVVVYRGLYENGPVWVRSLRDFTAKVDKEKYPTVSQEYRFELQEIQSVVKR